MAGIKEMVNAEKDASVNMQDGHGQNGEKHKPIQSDVDTAMTDLPWYMLILWILFTISAVTSFFVAVVYWTVVHEPQRFEGGSLFNHAVPALVLLLDIFLTRFPVRLLHVIYPLMYFAAYAVFTIVYWATGQTDVYGGPHAYTLLNYEETLSRGYVFLALFMFVAVPFLHGCVFLLCKLRNRIHDKLPIDDDDETAI